jgi:glycosyltransferase involved in cell wall biosynthesis
MPCHNAMPYLRLAVDSILQQSFKDFELIVLNDASTDESAAYLDGLVDPRLRIIHGNEKWGPTRRFQQGNELAQGQIIARQDADDISMPDRLQKQIDWLSERNDVVMVAARSVYIDEKGKGRHISPQVTGASALRSRLLYGNPIIHGSVCMRREALEHVGGYDTSIRVAQDFDLWVRLASAFDIECMPDVLYKYRLHKASITSQKRKAQLAVMAQARKGALQTFKKWDVPATAFALGCFWLALYEVSEGGDARPWIAKMLEMNVDFDEIETAMLWQLVGYAVAEVSPDARLIGRNAAMDLAGLQFIDNVLACLPEKKFQRLRHEVYPEYHINCAVSHYKGGEGRQCMAHALQGWRAAPLHRRNLRLLKQIMRSMMGD